MEPNAAANALSIGAEAPETPAFDEARFAEVDLAAIRARLGWSQERMAEEMGCNRSQISRWEAGTGRPPKLAQRQYWRLHVQLQRAPQSEAAQ